MKEDDYTEIYRFLNGEMAGEERRSFERRLEEEPELEREVADHQDLLKGVALYGDTRLAGAIRQSAENARKNGFLITDEQIVQYLNGELPDDQAAVFGNRLLSDAAFAEEVEFQRSLLASVNLAGDKALKARIRQTHSKLGEKGFLQAAQTEAPSEKADARPPAKRRQLFSVRALAAAATVLLLLAIGYFLYPTTDATQQLYSAHYQPDEEELQEQLEKLSLVGMAIPDKARRESLSAALNIFQSGNFDAASEALGQHLEAWQEDESARYFLALSLMETGQFGEAVATFQPLTTRAGTAYYDKALWYQGLSYLRLPGRQARAKSIFTLLAAVPSSGYKKQAEEILKGLE
ncbi:MAG: hypothetical protein KDD10_29110 [Phaeodactylibacter sp.]|nr:hypothetical protein [Phaeodactylibacter sp.]